MELSKYNLFARKIETMFKENRLNVGHVMSTDLITVSPDDNMEKVNELLSKNFIRHLPVINESNHLMGLITHRDLLNYSYSKLLPLNKSDQDSRFKQLRVERVMTKGVSVISPNSPLEDAAKVLYEKKYGCLPVVKNGYLVGIVTESDFVFLVANLISRRKSKGDGQSEE